MNRFTLFLGGIIMINIGTGVGVIGGFTGIEMPQFMAAFQAGGTMLWIMAWATKEEEKQP